MQLYVSRVFASESKDEFTIPVKVKFPILGCSPWNWKLDKARPYLQVSESRVFALESLTCYGWFSGVRLGISI